MFKYIMSRKDSIKGIIGVCICVVAFIIGQLILNHISTMENPPLGNTIYILIGSTFVFTSVLGVVLIIKYLYDSKKRKDRKDRKRRNHKIYYLKNKKIEEGKNIDF